MRLLLCLLLLACGNERTEERRTRATPRPQVDQLAVQGRAIVREIPAPPGYELRVERDGEYAIDASAAGAEPHLYLYRSDVLIADDARGGPGNDARIVRFLGPGTYQVRLAESRGRAFTARISAQRLAPLTPVGALQLGEPMTIEFGEVGFENRPENDRDAARAATLLVSAAGTYRCTASMESSRRARIALIGHDRLIAHDDQGFGQSEASIERALAPGTYVVRVSDVIRRGETRATLLCRGPLQ